MQSMALGFAILAWWTWPLIVVCCVIAMIIAFHILGWLEDRRSERDTDQGPVPCLAHVGTNALGADWWCMRRHGHGGGHDSPWFIAMDEDPDYPNVCLRSSNCRQPYEHDGRCVLEY